MPPPQKKSTDDFILPFLVNLSPFPPIQWSPSVLSAIPAYLLMLPLIRRRDASAGRPVSDSALKLPDVLPGAEDLRACKRRPPDIIPPDACQTFILPQSQCGHCRGGWQPPERDPAADAALLNLLIVSFITHKEQLGRGDLGHPWGS